MKKIFGTELFGFNKKDVSAFIQKLSVNSKDYNSGLSEKCNSLEEQVKSKDDSISELKEKINILNSENEALRSRLSECAGAHKELCGTIEEAIEKSKDKFVF